MDVFVPEISAKHAIDFPSPTVEPLDQNGHVRRVDIVSGLVNIVIGPVPHIQNGDLVTYTLRSSAGTWAGRRTVQDAAKPLHIGVQPVVSSPMHIRYIVERADGTPVGKSSEATYQIVP
ncbi:hypothetical protein DYL61_24085 [Pseudomonas nabeulensis]|uniref:Uncharacterized protein n=1 Tax=Pseudomonas nabeulensis TaxID=2293833 RepID=A0A4Z0AQX0_9PSED|nr:hypothetical protein DYL61_24085 [Pseudomonas nabeulensis]